MLSGDVVVIGGGNVAIDAARTGTRCGASSVSMYCLESRDTMPASEEEIAEAEEEAVTIHCGWGPKENSEPGWKSDRHCAEECVSVTDEQGRFALSTTRRTPSRFPCSHVILSVGQSILWGNLLDGSKVELGRGDGAVADPLTYQSAEPDIFVGGDVYTGPKFAIDAIAAGREGAISIHRFVSPLA